MAGRAVRETLTLAGRAERARLARPFVGQVGEASHVGGVAGEFRPDGFVGQAHRRSGQATVARDRDAGYMCDK
jgi:hypothetical protein